MARSKGTGGITRLEQLPKAKCRKWRLEAVDGSGKRRYRKFQGTYAQAEAALRRFEAELARPVSAETFSEYAAEWLAMREVSGQTAARDSIRVRNLERAFGDMCLSDIRRQDVQAGIASIRDGGNLSGRRLSGTTMNGIFSTFKQIMQEAMYDGLIESNPAATVRPPKVDTAKKKAVPIDDVARMLDHLEMLPLDGYTVAVRLAVLAGNRRGEIVGYQWDDVEPGRLVVRRSINSRTGVAKAPKTESGHRRIPMLPPLEATLSRWREVQRYRLAVLGIEQTGETPVVTSRDGTRLDSSNLYRWWKRNAPELFGIDCTLHELRHTFLTMLANSGATAQSVKSIAGWSSIAMADVYVHTDEEADALAVEGLGDRLLSR